MAYPRMYPKDREITREIASWLLTRIPNADTDTTGPTPRSMPRRRPVPLHESHKRYTLCFLVVVLGMCFCLTWVIGSYSECSRDPPISREPFVYDWDGVSRTLNEQVNYYCVNDSHSSIAEVYVCGKERTWDLYKTGSCECLAPVELPQNDKLWAVLNTSRLISSIVNYYCVHKKTKKLLKYGTAVCNPRRKWKIVHNDTSQCQL